MTTEITSPRRRHILSSINPDRVRLSPPPDDPQAAPPPEPSQPPGEAAESGRDSRSPVADAERKERSSRTSKFRFKSTSSRSHRSSRHRERERDHHHDGDRARDDGEERGDDGRGGGGDRDDGEQRHHRRRRHHHHHRKHGRRRRRSRTRSPTPPNPYEPPPLDPEAAFRASLFDAMADDEGAAYWEGVYGQPMHVYANERPGPRGELEQMTDDEYAAHVRQRMWEKTHQGLLEERARREEQRRARDDAAAEARRLTRQMEESLRRGEARRRRRGRRAQYDDYARRWEAWDGCPEGISWPVPGGRRADVEPAAVRDFFVHGLDPVEMGEKDFLARLKEERVRWHPDKMQQRLGDKFDEAVQRDVTAVFQVIDRLWSDIRAKAKA